VSRVAGNINKRPLVNWKIYLEDGETGTDSLCPLHIIVLEASRGSHGLGIKGCDSQLSTKGTTLAAMGFLDGDGTKTATERHPARELRKSRLCVSAQLCHSLTGCPRASPPTLYAFKHFAACMIGRRSSSTPNPNFVCEGVAIAFCAIAR
jgi:hypothetical protein